MNKLICLATIWIVFAGQALAQAPWIDRRVVHMTDGGTGSFVEIGEGTYLLSCAHRDARHSMQIGDRVDYVCNDGAMGNAKVIAVARDENNQAFRDCALYDIGGQLAPRYKRFKISQRAMQPGERVWVCGFPMGADFSSRTTTVVSDGGGGLWLSGKATPGESGGPIVNTDGELIGTLTGYTPDGYTICSGRAPVIQLCQRYFGGNCQNGQCGGNGGMGSYMQPPGYSQQPYYPPQQPTRPNLPPSYPTTPPIVSQTPSQSCPCGPKWQALTAVIDKQIKAVDLQLEVNAELRKAITVANTNIANIKNEVTSTINQKFETYSQEHPAPVVPTKDEIVAAVIDKLPKPPTAAEVAAEVEKTRKPPRLRLKDSPGRVVTPYVTLNDGTDNDLIVDQIFSQTSTTAQ